jgi:hypothetical protein
MRNNVGRFAAVLAVFLVVFAAAIYAVSTATTVRFNIGTLVSYTLTLPGQTAVAGGADTATVDIAFNISNDTAYDVNAAVVGGGAGGVQQSGTPIYSFDNTGNVNVNLSVRLNMTLPSCITLWGNTTLAGVTAPVPGFQINASANTTVVNIYTPVASAQAWYMVADFANCMTNDSQVNMIRSTGVQS